MKTPAVTDPRFLEPELLDREAWEAPARLTPRDCLAQTGADWRWAAAEQRHREDDND